VAVCYSNGVLFGSSSATKGSTLCYSWSVSYEVDGSAFYSATTYYDAQGNEVGTVSQPSSGATAACVGQAPVPYIPLASKACTGGATCN
jgi:hypothetical protein